MERRDATQTTTTQRTAIHRHIQTADQMAANVQNTDERASERGRNSANTTRAGKGSPDQPSSPCTHARASAGLGSWTIIDDQPHRATTMTDRPTVEMSMYVVVLMSCISRLHGRKT